MSIDSEPGVGHDTSWACWSIRVLSFKNDIGCGIEGKRVAIRRDTQVPKCDLHFASETGRGRVLQFCARGGGGNTPPLPPLTEHLWEDAWNIIFLS